MKLIVSAHGMLAKEVVNSAGMVFGAIEITVSNAAL